MENIDYKGMSNYFTTSPATLKRWKESKPHKFEFMLEEFLESKTKAVLPENQTKIITVMNFKGGVGKSTIGSAICSYLGEGEAVILNLDISQPSAESNSCDTVDYSTLINKKTIKEIISKLSETYRYIIVDTPGEVMPETLEILQLSSRVVIPMTIGKKSRVGTISTLNGFFSEESVLKGTYDVYFLFNMIPDKKKRKKATEKFLEAYNEDFIKSPDITVNSSLGSLDFSNAIETAEEEDKSIFTLARENRLAYQSILKKINNTCMMIEKHLKL